MNHTVESTKNSTTTPLGFSTEWVTTGRAELVEHYAAISVLVRSDVVSAAQGLKFVWSRTGTSGFYSFPLWTYRLTDDQGNPISGAQEFASTVRGKYWYLAFEKSALDEQAVFEVTTLLHYAPLAIPVELTRDYLDRQRAAVPTKAYPVNTNYADWSSTIATGGVSQQVMPAREGRALLAFQNKSDVPMWIDLRSGTATIADLMVRPGGYFLENDVPTPAQVNVLCALTGAVYWAQDG